MYYSIPAFGDGRPKDGWGIGIAESRNLRDWTRIGEMVAETDYENKGVAAPFAKVIGKQVHLFYQTYGNGPKDAICHATSTDGIRFTRNQTNPIFHPTGDWNSGRAIDAEVFQFQGKWFLLAATRDPASKIQMLTGAVSNGSFDRSAWQQIGSGPLLKPELPWEKDCIEAPSVIVRGKELLMFYAGAYNNAPQQIGLARSRDGIHWERISSKPYLPVGLPGSWNSSESGHPGVFVDDDGKTYLFYQGNDDMGKTWKIGMLPLASLPK
jgi:beta-1,2-mannobiose phosphorylase / 1,2-beta-oligomannan phosphorylase